MPDPFILRGMPAQTTVGTVTGGASHCVITGYESLCDLDTIIRYLPATMVASLDQHIHALRRTAERKCAELQTSFAELEAKASDTLTVDEQLLVELYRLIDYIEYLRG